MEASNLKVHPLSERPNDCYVIEKDKNMKQINPYDLKEKNGNSIRFVCISDTHSKIDNTTLSLLPDDCDVLIHAGDFTMLSSEAEIKEFNEYLGSIKSKFKHIVVIAGNHELSFDENTWNKGGVLMSLVKLFNFRSPFAQYLTPVESRKLLTNCTYIQDETIELYGIKIYGSPWQPSHFSLAFNLPRGQVLLDKWNRIPSDTDILVTHGPPLGVGDLVKGRYRVGCAELLTTVKQRVQPKYHIFGHIHEDYGMWSDDKTVFVNASICDRKYNANHKPIVFDYQL